MGFYNDMAAMAQEMLAEFGGPVSIHRETGAVKDPVTGVVITPPSVEEINALGLVTSFQDELIDGVRITSQDRQLFINKPIQEGDKIELAGHSPWFVKQHSKVSPIGIDIIYKGQLVK